MSECERCGEPLDRFDVSVFGDGERRYITQPCGCPGPRCISCGRRLHAGRCPSLPVVECPLGGVIIPEPDIA